MPAPLGNSTRRTILRHLLSGLSYGKIAGQMGVSKSAVAGVWQEFGEGRTPGLEDLAEYAETLRATAAELRKEGVSVKDMALALSAMRTLAKLEVDPGQLQEYTQLGERLGQEGENASDVIQAALYLQSLEAATGLDYQALAETVKELAERHDVLQAEVAHLGTQQKELEELARECAALEAEVNTLQERRESLRKDVDQRERREGELGKRVQELEKRAHIADERLAVARKATEDLATMGLSPGDLAGLAQRVRAIAQKHNIATADVRSRLFAELENLGEAMNLEALIEVRKDELTDLKRDVEKWEGDKKTLQGAVTRLRGGQRRLEGSMDVLQYQAKARIQKVGEEVAVSLRQEGERLHGELEGLLGRIVEVAGQQTEDLTSTADALRGQVHHELQDFASTAAALRDQVLHELEQLRTAAGAMGRLEGTVESYGTLRHLANLLQGKDGLKEGEVRIAATALCLGLWEWLEGREAKEQHIELVRLRVEALLEALKRWRTQAVWSPQ